MNRARLKVIGKLMLLLGLPVSIVLGLFGGGVYCGVTHRGALLGFEHDVLGLDVEVPAAPKPAPPSTGGGPATTVEPAPAVQPTTEPPPSVAPPSDPPRSTPPTATPPTTTPPVEPTPETTTTVDPVSSDLAALVALPVRLRVKVVVDDELMRQRADWIDYVQRTVASASSIYQQQFGIDIELVGVSRWSVTTAGLSADQLLSELRTRPREGADVLVGMTARPLDGSISGEAETPTPESAFNGAYGIVYAVPRAREPHLRTLLHELAHMFGALDVTDPQDPAWQAASWMSYAPVRDGQVPWIDAENRKRVLSRKDKPFAPEPDSAPPAAEDLNPTL
ncbi:MAG: hypothetical protein IPK74_28325 [Deltaproteobacteria bacterium]|nr:hypothetical protein [Deltaproteobacteria bacterium]